MTLANSDRQTTTKFPISCPCLLIAAPSSGSGKTTLTAALARWHVRQGRTVRIFKAGPDYIDPMILQQACDAPVYSLDPGMMSEDHCRHLLYQAASEADLILIEGVMGLFDGHYSAALIARTFNIPLLLTVDARAMAETFAAIVYGLGQSDDSLLVWGCAANRIASPRHEEMVREGVAQHPKLNIAFKGSLPRDAAISFPERHLGLAQAQEIQDLHTRLDRAADHLHDQALTQLPPAVSFYPAQQPTQQPEIANHQLKDKTIAVARDQAFSFVYAANLDFLREQGARLVFTSPLKDTALPDCDMVYFPGGYPELHAEQLSQNTSYLESVRQFQGRIVAECGGMIYLSATLTLLQGEQFSLCNCLPLTTQLHDKLQAIGWQHDETPSGKFLAHSFHYSSTEPLASSLTCHQAQTHRGAPGEMIYSHNNIIASYLHWYFYSNPEAAIALFV